jgi:hypothetical protein
MKKKIFLLTTILAATALLFLSSCLKDKSHYVNFGQSGTWVDFPKGGAVNYGGQAITDAGDTVGRKFAVNVASPELQTIATTVTFKVNDQATVDAYNKSQSAVFYTLMPADAYKITTTKVTIAAGQLFGYDSVTFYKDKMDPSKSYMMPITMISTTNGKLTANLNTLLYHFIGNPFAGSYTYDYTRTPPSGNIVGGTASLSPVTPTDVEGFSGYYTGKVRYEFSFTANPDGTYSDLTIALNSDDVASILNANSINVTQAPVFVSTGTSTIAGPLTFAEAVKDLDWVYMVVGPSGGRTVEDHFYH